MTEEHDNEQHAASPSVGRAQALAVAVQSRAERAARRAQAERERHDSIDATFEMVDRDGEVGGGIMAGALAYRLFIWLLPLALVAIAGLGIAAHATAGSPEHAAKSIGLAGLVSSSVAGAAKSSARWYALLIGIPILLYTTRSLQRALIVTHRLVWADLRDATPKPTIGATVRLLAIVLGFFVVSGLAAAARAWSGGGGLLATLLLPLPYAALWALVAVHLPHRDAPWKALIPGAIVVGIGIEVLHVVTAYLIAPQAISKQGAYGSLGIAAALLFGLYLLSRLIVASAVVNATLWGRRSRTGSARVAPRPGA